jgi:hypothetical protein
MWRCGESLGKLTCRTVGKNYRRVKEIDELDDPCEPECDTVQIHEYCEAAALFGQMVRMPSSDELP